MLRMTAMYVPKRELPSSSCIPGSKSFPGVPAPRRGREHPKGWEGREEWRTSTGGPCPPAAVSSLTMGAQGAIIPL